MKTKGTKGTTRAAGGAVEEEVPPVVTGLADVREDARAGLDEDDLPRGPGPGTGSVPVYRDEVPGEEARAEEGAKRREEIFDKVHAWRGVTLRPFSLDRETLFLRVRGYWPVPAPWEAADVEEPEAVREMRVRECLPEAWVILYLCSHEPEEWEGWQCDVARWVREVTVWGLANVARDEVIAAVELALEIQDEVVQMMAVSRGRGSGRGKL